MNIAINDISRSIAAWEEFGSLTGLSIQYTRPGATPTAPSNEDRARAFREAQPVALGNHFDWPFLHHANENPSANGSIAADEKPAVPVEEKSAGARRLSLVRVA